MSKITLRLPSKQVQYGYVEIEATAEELGSANLADNPDMLGKVYMHFVNTFWEGEREALKAIQDDVKAAEAPTKRAEVVAELGSDTRVLEAIVETERDRKTYQVGDKVTVGGIEFTKHSEDGLDDLAIKALDDALGVTVLESKDAEAPYAKPVAAKAKPWEKKAAPKAAPEIDWS